MQSQYFDFALSSVLDPSSPADSSQKCQIAIKDYSWEVNMHLHQLPIVYSDIVNLDECRLDL